MDHKLTIDEEQELPCCCFVASWHWKTRHIYHSDQLLSEFLKATGGGYWIDCSIEPVLPVIQNLIKQTPGWTYLTYEDHPEQVITLMQQCGVCKIPYWSTNRTPFETQSPNSGTSKEWRELALEKANVGQYHEALQLLTRVIDNDPSDAIANYNLSAIIQMLPTIPTRLAIPTLFRVVQSNPEDSSAHSILTSILFPLEPELVIAGYQALMNTTHPTKSFRAQHALASLTGQAATSDPGYVKAVFDDLSETFEEKLVDRLQYRVPWELLEGIHELSGVREANWVILDLGKDSHSYVSCPSLSRV